MLEAASEALANIFVFERLLFIVGGVLMGLALGVIPGLGGVVGLSILLPFAIIWDPVNSIAMMIGLLTVTNTSDSIAAILFGVPGTGGSQATVLDGHPMAQKGEAGRALGAAFSASIMGGVFGGLVLALAVPVLRPAVLAFGSPEFFMLGIFGISMVAVLSGRKPIRGIVVGLVGLILGAVGQDPQTGVTRWTFDELYLLDGLPLVSLALGLFAIPEIADLLIKGTKIADVPATALKGAATGVRDTLRNWLLVLRSAGFGVWLGAIPGIGSSVVDWFAYGQAAQTVKGARQTFGAGDVRGVIAPDASVNAKDGGTLIPTLAFGVPGNSPTALLLGVLVISGFQPGPDMLTEHLDVTYTMIWTLVLANIIGAGICLGLARYIAKLAQVRIHYLAPLVLSVIFMAAFQATRHWGDLWVLMAAALLGWTMKRLGWPRPPLLLGFVLSPILEGYLWISSRIYGFSWVTRPVTIVIGMLILGSLAYGIRSERRFRAEKREVRQHDLDHTTT